MGKDAKLKHDRRWVNTELEKSIKDGRHPTDDLIQSKIHHVKVKLQGKGEHNEKARKNAVQALLGWVPTPPSLLPTDTTKRRDEWLVYGRYGWFHYVRKDHPRDRTIIVPHPIDHLMYIPEEDHDLTIRDRAAYEHEVHTEELGAEERWKFVNVKELVAHGFLGELGDAAW